MSEKTHRIVIIGDGETAELAYEYFTHDSPYEVAAFSAEAKYMTRTELFGLPVVPFDELDRHYSPTEFKAFVALSYTQLNRARTRLYLATKERGYSLVSYVSSRAFVWHNVEIGENCFIFENNVLQYHVRVGNNVVLWSGNHVGHRTVIHDNCFISSHVVISGYCEVGANTFMGVNSCIGNNLAIAEDCVIGAGAVVLKETEPGKVYRGNPATPSHISSFVAFGVKGS